MHMDSRDDDEARECWLLRVRGSVQGVGYRDACVRHARTLGIAGWVRNRLDGSVEITLQGSRQQLEAMCGRLRDEVPGARVDTLDITEVQPPFPRLNRFERLATL